MPILTQENYPNLLSEIHDIPKQLYYFGDINLIYKPSISIVGTRKNSTYGKFITEKIIEELSNYEINIISGLAKGIDTIAHKSAIKNNLNTIAVLGSGLKNIYPKENLNLAREIFKKGLLVSEFPYDELPKKMNFPKRNRIISALSLGTLVVEAPIKSGALITADFALDQGREVFTIPGDIDQLNAQGPLKLLKDSAAHPISSGDDIINILKNIIKPKKTSLEINSYPKLKLSSIQIKILKSISLARGTHLNIIEKKTKIPVVTLLTELSLLEIKKIIKKDQGKYFKKIKSC